MRVNWHSKQISLTHSDLKKKSEIQILTTTNCC
jgi:hypothetical protein